MEFVCFSMIRARRVKRILGNCWLFSLVMPWLDEINHHFGVVSVSLNIQWELKLVLIIQRMSLYKLKTRVFGGQNRIWICGRRTSRICRVRSTKNREVNSVKCALIFLKDLPKACHFVLCFDFVKRSVSSSYGTDNVKEFLKRVKQTEIIHNLTTKSLLAYSWLELWGDYGTLSALSVSRRRQD